jgi:TorA maturation chaperone TorD
MGQFEQTEGILAARRYLYALFQSLFGAEPSMEQFRAISLSLVREAFAILWEGDALTANNVANAPATTTDFLTVLDGASKNPKSLSAEYTQVLVGPNKLPAPPWESVYVTGERVIFQRSTLKIRNFYRSQGFIPQLYPKVADDHIALELDFLRLLAERTLGAWHGEDREDKAGRDEYVESLQAGGDFLTEHLLQWIDRFARDLALSGKSAFYSTFALTLVLFANRDRELIPKLLQEREQEVTVRKG